MTHSKSPRKGPITDGSDLFVGPEAEDLSAEDRALAEKGFALLDAASVPAPGPEQWMALRESVLLDTHPELVDREVVSGAGMMDILASQGGPTVPLSLRSKVLNAIDQEFEASRASEDAATARPSEQGAKGWSISDERLWTVGGLAIAMALTAWSGAKPTEGVVGGLWGLYLPPVLFIAVALVASRLLLRGGAGAAWGAIALAVSAIGATGWLGLGMGANAAGHSLSLAAGVPCLAIGGLTGLMLALPFAVRRSSIGSTTSFGIGAVGALFGAAALHLHCPGDLASHYVFFHGGGIAAAGLLAFLAARIATSLRASTAPAS